MHDRRGEALNRPEGESERHQRDAIDRGTPRPSSDDASPHDRIKPGSPTAENAAFVVLGTLGALYAIARIAGLV